MALIASGTMIEAPRAVIVPETLMIGRRPRRSRIGVLLVALMADAIMLNFLGAEFEDGFDLDSDIIWEGRNADSRAGMLADLAEYGGEQV